MRTVRDVEKPFELMLWFYWIAGLSVVEIPVGHPWLKLSIFFAVIRWIIYTYLLLYPLERIVVDQQKSTLDKIFVFVHYTNIFSAITSTVVEFYNYKKYLRFTKRITIVDDTLRIFGIDPKHSEACKENRKRILGFCFGLILLYSAIMLMTTYVFVKISHMHIFFIVYEVPVVWNTLVELNLAIQIVTVRKRFERLNIILKKMAIIPMPVNLGNLNENEIMFKKKQLDISIIPNYYYQNTNNIELFLKISRQMHLELCKIFREINQTYNRAISMQMVALFALLIGLSYFPYYIYSEKKIISVIKMPLQISVALLLIYNVSRIIHITSVVVNAGEMAHASAQIAHQISISRSQQKIIDEIHEFSLQIMQHPLSFIIAGSTSLNFEYLGELIGSIITYVMLLIQTELGITDPGKVRFA